MELIVFGSTGSIGVQTLDCAENLGYNVSAMSAGENTELFEKQIRKFRPRAVAMKNTAAAARLREKISDINIPVFEDEKGILRLLDECPCDVAVNGIVGIAGLLPTLEAAKKGLKIALANKESLIVAGEIIKKVCAENYAEIIPTDSEHSAIFQCLNGICPTKDDIKTIPEKVSRLILTASGGAFYGKTKDELKNLKAEKALLHPTWKMGAKITVDCATMMNKGFEIIEAVRLFDLPENKVDVIIHRESIIHSMLEFCDSSVLAQMSLPDMRVAIQYALTYPKRKPSPVEKLDFKTLSSLTFAAPDYETFRAPLLCRQALNAGGTAPAVLNAANEKAVKAFLENRINFCEITDFAEKMLEKYPVAKNPSIGEILEIDGKIRSEAI